MKNTMNLFERVKYSLIGKPYISILLFVLFFLLGTFISSMFSIYQATITLERNIKEQLPGIVLVDWQEFEISNEKKIEVLNQFKDDQRISLIENRYQIINTNYHFQFRKDEKNISGYLDPFYNLIGIDQPNVSDVLDEESLIMNGRVFTQEEIDNGEKVLFFTCQSGLESLFSNINENDQISLWVVNNTSLGWELDLPETKIMELKFVGIGKANRNKDNLLDFHSSLNGMNTVGKIQYIPLKTLEEISKKMILLYNDLSLEYSGLNEYSHLGEIYLSETYIRLVDANDIKEFTNDIKRIVNENVDYVYSFSESFNDVKSIINRLSSIASVGLAIISISSILLITFVMQIMVKERKYEIGVYISLGESKKKIMYQIALEILIVGMLGIGLSTISGHMLGKYLSANLLEQQMIQYETLQKENISEYEIDEKMIFESFEVSITKEYIVCVLSSGIAIIMISCIIPLKTILKMKPKKIMM